MCIILRLVDVKADEVHWHRQDPVDRLESLRASIRAKGLGDLPTVRSVNGGYRIVAGANLLQCLLSLVEVNETCFDRRTGRLAGAAEVYRRIPAWLIDLQRHEGDRFHSRQDRELEVLLYIVVARALRAPLDGRRLEWEVAHLHLEHSDLFPVTKGYPDLEELGRRVATLSAAQIDKLLSAGTCFDKQGCWRPEDMVAATANAMC
jgi:hypothetical protein